MSPLEKGRIDKVSDVLTSEAKAEIHGDGSRHQSVAEVFFLQFARVGKRKAACHAGRRGVIVNGNRHRGRPVRNKPEGAKSAIKPLPSAGSNPAARTKMSISQV